MRHILSSCTIERFVSFGTHIFGIDPALPAQQIADKTIEAVYDLFASFGMPMHLTEVGIDDSRLPEMAHHSAVNEGLEHAWAPRTEQDLLEILTASL